MRRSLADERRKTLCEMLIAGRKAAGLSQADVAKKVGKPQPFVSRYEMGERQIEVVELIELCEVLGLDPARVVGDLVKTPS
jgi:transcriptional regulator with XRE-family HTH domain